MTIENQSEYEAARRRIVELGNLPEGTPGAETELNVLVELTTAWEDEHSSQVRVDEQADRDKAGRT